MEITDFQTDLDENLYRDLKNYDTEEESVAFTDGYRECMDFLCALNFAHVIKDLNFNITMNNNICISRSCVFKNK